ncbi:MAG: hypothetical protein Fur0037_10930 [Planctomycetota bacterium]
MTALAEIRARTRTAGSGILSVSILVLALAAGTVPLGSVAAPARPWFAAALGLWSCAVLAQGRGLPFFARQCLLPLACFAGVALLQVLPVRLPDGETATAMLGAARPSCGSIVPMRTIAVALEIPVLIGLFAASSSLLRCTRRSAALCSSLAAIGAGHAIYGALMQHGVLPSIDPEQTRSVLVSTYFNRNHCAGLLEMAFLAGLGAACASRAASTRIALAACLSACALGLLGTESRGGTIGLCAGIAAFLFLAPSHRRGWSLLFVALAVAAIAWAVPESLAARMRYVGDELAQGASRPAIWLGAIRLWLAFPWLGTGLGTYGDISPATQDPSIAGRIEHAHSDPLELLAESGIAGFAALLLALGIFARGVLASRSSAAATSQWIRAGAAGAAFALLVHGVVDFNLRIPANAAWFAVLAACAIAGQRGAPVGASANRAAAILLLPVSLWLAGRAVLAPGNGMSLVEAGERALAANPSAAANLAREALAVNPLSPSAHRLLGSALARLGEPAAHEAFAESLRWTVPSLRDRRRLEIALDCLMARDIQASRRWIAELFRCDPSDWPAYLADLHACVPAYEPMAALLPGKPRALRLAFAAELLRSGDFAGREAELAAQRGEDAPALLTLEQGVRLRSISLPKTRRSIPCQIAATLSFEVDSGIEPTTATLTCSTEGASLARSFRPSSSPFSWTFELDPSFPPGPYEIALRFGEGHSFPLGSVLVADEILPLRSGNVYRANEHLRLRAANPWAPRTRAASGPRLLPGDRVERAVSVPAAGMTLVLRCSRGASLRATFRGADLDSASSSKAPVRRYRLTGSGEGILCIQNTGGKAAEIREFFAAEGI